MKKINLPKTIIRSKAFFWGVFHGEFKFSIIVIRLGIEALFVRYAISKGKGDGSAL